MKFSAAIALSSQMRRFVEGEITRWMPVIKTVGLKLD
jgi:hypothetical protein